MDKLFSAETDEGRKFREDWLRKLFSNPNITAIDKVVLTAFVFWYYPAHARGEDGNEVFMNFSEFAPLAGLPADVAEMALKRLWECEY